MGRAYAGILGPLAFALVIARSAASGGGMEATLLAASLALFAFAAVGYLAGQMADYLVRDTVRTQFQRAMADWKDKSRGLAPDNLQRSKTQTKSTT
jgi:hypothetical protein